VNSVLVNCCVCAAVVGFPVSCVLHNADRHDCAFQFVAAVAQKECFVRMLDVACRLIRFAFPLTSPRVA
jgi:hypothetical protein